MGAGVYNLTVGKVYLSGMNTALTLTPINYLFLFTKHFRYNYMKNLKKFKNDEVVKADLQKVKGGFRPITGKECEDSGGYWNGNSCIPWHN